MDALLRFTMVHLYGEANVAELDAGTIRSDAPAEPVVVPDQAEAARFADEIERDAAMGDRANWPDL